MVVIAQLAVIGQSASLIAAHPIEVVHWVSMKPLLQPAMDTLTGWTTDYGLWTLDLGPFRILQIKGKS